MNILSQARVELWLLLTATKTGQKFESSYTSVYWERVLVRLPSASGGLIFLLYVENGFIRNVAEDFEFFEDFFSGVAFQKYAQRLECFPHTESDKSGCRVEHILVFKSTDGAPAFQSGIKTVWPIIVFLGNTSPKQRYTR